MNSGKKSKLVLGTVQLGLTYGLANSTGKPVQEDAWGILDEALVQGIDIFDTAYAYGNSEDVIGDWIKARGKSDEVRIISKMKPHVLNDYPDGTKAIDVVRFEIEKSLRRLCVDVLDGYLFHSSYYIYLNHLIEGLQKAKAEGLTRHIGVSTYDEAEALQALECGIDYIQVPYNVFDQRLDKTDFFKTAREKGVTVFARSPFLQGLTLMTSDQIPPHLAYARPHVEKFRSIITAHGVGALEASLQFALQKAEADYIVVGVETVKQLKDLCVFETKPRTDDIVTTELRSAFMNMDRTIVNPSLWSKIRR
jgi:aryl-alcohol dehydrogenase-like predicted oxidoreductase